MYTKIKKTISLRQVLLCLIALMATNAYAQPNYLSIFGNTSGSCPKANRMTCTGTPGTSSFTEIPVIADGTSLASTNANYFQNSVYDKSGNLLFSVNADGIYNSDGSLNTDFTTEVSMTFDYSGAHGTFTGLGYNLSPAGSEIVLFPKTMDIKNSSYYAVYWAVDNIIADGHAGTYYLMATEIDLDPFTNAITAVTPNVLYDASTLCSTGCTPVYWVQNNSNYGMCVVADAVNLCNSRDIYTLEEANGNVACGWSTTNHTTVLKKWTFGADGSLPNSDAITTIATPCIPAVSNNAKIFSYYGDKYFTFIATDGVTPSEYSFLDMIKIADGSETKLGTVGDQHSIYGFEYLERPATYEAMMVSYHDYSTSSTSGMGWFNMGVSFLSHPFTAIASTSDYGYSDLELDKNGDLLVVNGAHDVSTDGQLASITTSGIPGTAPTVLNTTCGGTPPVYVSNRAPVQATGRYIGFSPYYIANQIRGEDYNKWNSQFILPYNVTGNETWTPASNPANGFGTVPGSTAISSLNIYGGIAISPNRSLTLEGGLTLNFAPLTHVDVYQAWPGLVPNQGGKLIVNDATLTHYVGPCATGLLWGGVQLWGDPNIAQGIDPYYSPQPSVFMNPGSKISYAYFGVQAGAWSSSAPGYSSGGGFILANGATFSENSYGVFFWPYHNTIGRLRSSEHNNFSQITNSSFYHSSTDVFDASTYGIYGIFAAQVLGIKVLGCSFDNEITGRFRDPAVNGIMAQDAGISVADFCPGCHYPAVGHRSVFTNYNAGIIHIRSGINNNTINVTNSTFTNNSISINCDGTYNAHITHNIFNIPYFPLRLYGVALPAFIDPSRGPRGVDAIGVFMNKTESFQVRENTFVLGTSWLSDLYNHTIGILNYNTSNYSDNNVYLNTFNGLGVACLANMQNWCNFYPGEYGKGLWYECNNYAYNNFDIATVGTPATFGSDGIKVNQGFPSGGSISLGLPAGNKFSSRTSGYTTYSFYDEFCSSINYYYDDPSEGGLPNENPGSSSTGYLYPTSPAPITIVDNTYRSDGCTVYPIVLASGQQITFDGSNPIPLMPVPNPNDPPGPVADVPGFNNAAILNNVNYYSLDSNGVTHRDSLYYWLGQIQSPAADLQIASMLLNDGYADSATNFYDSIVPKYGITGADSLMFATTGAEMFQVFATITNVSVNFWDSVANHTDPTDTAWKATTPYAYTIDSTTESMMIDAFVNGSGWAKNSAKNLLMQYDSLTYDSLITIMPDTLLYPNPKVNTNPSNGPGVLTVQEISTGATSGCDYALMLASNCGNNDSATVDVRGWVLDDNNGEFDTVGCDVGYGITTSHYRLAYDSVWKNVPVGSLILAYNANNNCYNLPDSFYIDTVYTAKPGSAFSGLIYMVPIGGTELAPMGKPHMERFTIVDSSMCGYTIDSLGDTTITDSTAYATASDWANTVKLDPTGDAFQVRCPRCDRDMRKEPAFYHGIGYGPAAGTGGKIITPIAPGSKSLGGAVVTHTGEGYTYTFKGGTIDDLSDPTQWNIDLADTAGFIPSLVYNISPEIFGKVVSNTLYPPCCSNGHDGGDERNSHHKENGKGNNPNGTQGGRNNTAMMNGFNALQPTGINNPNTLTGTNAGVNCFPNPATLSLNFTFPAQTDIIIKITDVTGQVMETQQVNNAGFTTFDVHTYPKGVYMYQVVLPGSVVTGKVVIE